MEVHMELNENANHKRAVPSEAAEVHRERREFLEKCGRFAAYTTPAVLLLLHFQKEEAYAGSPP
jgi:hypothetical protein